MLKTKQQQNMDVETKQTLKGVETKQNMAVEKEQIISYKKKTEQNNGIQTEQNMGF